MATINAPVLLSAPSITPTTFFGRSQILGTVVQGLPPLVSSPVHISTLKIEAKSRGKPKSTPAPNGPSGGTKFRDGVDASGRKAKGKGVYQFTNKYGANVDGYSPIYSPEEWSITGDTYSGGTGGLALWAVTLGAVLLGGALLVYNTSALSQ